MWVLWGIVRRLLVRVLFALGLRKILAHLLGARERGAPGSRAAWERWASGDVDPQPDGAVVIDIEPMGLFAHYSDDARRMVARAVDLAHAEDEDRPAGTPHLLVALVEGSPGVRAVLVEHGVDAGVLREAIAADVGARSRPGRPITDGLEDALRAARHRAAARGGVDVLPRDLLAAVVVTGDKQARDLLHVNGRDVLAALRKTLT